MSIGKNFSKNGWICRVATFKKRNVVISIVMVDNSILCEICTLS